jgi:hypothetical protein
MQTIGLIFAIFAAFGMLLGFIPFLGWFNWLNIPFAIVTLIINVIALIIAKESKTPGLIGLALSIVVIFFGLIRLVLGGGIL